MRFKSLDEEAAGLAEFKAMFERIWAEAVEEAARVRRDQGDDDDA